MISNLDVSHLLGHFKKWGPSAYSCVGLARGYLTEGELQVSATKAARQFAKCPDAVSMESPTDTLFTVYPSRHRSSYTLKVATPYLCSLVMEQIAGLDAVKQALFYHNASQYPVFKGMWGYFFEKYFLVWLYSVKRTNPLLCTAKSTWPAKPINSRRSAKPSNSNKSKSSMPTTDDLSHLEPLGQKRLTVIDGDSYFGKAKDSDTPFGWVPASRNFPSIDAVICTKERIITIQVTVSSKQTMKPDGFERLKRYLPAEFQEPRTWCHVFVTDCDRNAESLRRQHHQVAVDKGIFIYSTVLDISAHNFSSEDVKRPFSPSVCGYM